MSVETIIQKKIILTPWKNKQEFTEVYDLLFSESSNRTSKNAAYNKMLIWKVRCHDKTPASILSMMVLLEVELQSENSGLNEGDLSTIYSNALTTFLNYMTSVTQVKRFKTMYQAAEELGIDSYLIDLRHLCAHGTRTPSIETLRRMHKYCIDWLKAFYWDNIVTNHDPVTGVRLKEVNYATMETKLNVFFNVYDNATEAILRDDEYRDDPEMPIECFRSTINGEDCDLPGIAKSALKNIVTFVNNNQNIAFHKISVMLCSMILNSKYKRYFLESPTKKITNGKNLIKIHQHLFRMLSSFGLIVDFMNGLIRIAENPSEHLLRCKGAIFWMENLVIAFDVLKLFYLTTKEMIDNSDTEAKINFTELNKEVLGSENLRILDHLGHNEQTIIIFGESSKQLNSFEITKQFIEHRIRMVNDITLNFVITCIDNYVGADMTEAEKKKFRDLLFAYTNSDMKQHCEFEHDDNMVEVCKDGRIYTLDDLCISQASVKQNAWQNSGNIEWSIKPFGLNLIE